MNNKQEDNNDFDTADNERMAMATRQMIMKMKS